MIRKRLKVCLSVYGYYCATVMVVTMFLRFCSYDQDYGCGCYVYRYTVSIAGMVTATYSYTVTDPSKGVVVILWLLL